MPRDLERAAQLVIALGYTPVYDSSRAGSKPGAATCASEVAERNRRAGRRRPNPNQAKCIDPSLVSRHRPSAVVLLVVDGFIVISFQVAGSSVAFFSTRWSRTGARWLRASGFVTEESVTSCAPRDRALASSWAFSSVPPFTLPSEREHAGCVVRDACEFGSM